MTPPDPAPPAHPLPLRGAAVVLARARFVLLVGGLLGLIAAWPYLTNLRDKLTQSPPTEGSVSADTEYWCPMCPGVVSDWPAKCPVCYMTLVRRQKGDMTPLPDGVVARVQLSPYRVQLAGIHTSPVEYRRLEAEAVVAGLLEASPGTSSPLALWGEVFERDGAWLAVGHEGQATCDAAPGEALPARVVEAAPGVYPAAGRRVRVLVENPRGELRPGSYAAARFRFPVSRLDSTQRHERERWRDRVAVASVAGPDWAFLALTDAAVRQAAAREGFVLSVPEMAVIDTGTRQAVYVEAMPGMYDAVEVRLGRRCGDFYPVRSGLEPGQRVVTAGAVLLDAETRLNPSLAASYFGAGPRTAPASTPAAPTDPSADDRRLIEKQKNCPVTGEPLGSMGEPVKVTVDGRTLFVCCKACERPLRQKPAQYLSKLP